MKKNLIFGLAGFFLLAGCFKDSVHNNADSTAYFAITNGGPLNLASAPLNLTIADSTILYINPGITSPYTLTKDVNVILEVDDAARIAYNQQNGTNYEALPDSLYYFSDSSGVVTAGARSISLPITIYTGKADLRKSYMLPITIRDAQGLAISSDLGTIYYNQLGSPIAGRYAVSGKRTDYVGPMADNVISDTVALSTVANKISAVQSANVILLDYADLGIAGWQYIVTFNPANETVSIAPNDVMLNNETGFMYNSFKIDVQEYNPATRVLHFKTEYNDQSGNARVIDEYLTPQ
ncbi:MAG TPA: DUF1735 domain-containing protein [Chitinophagaceae bacterium]|nr:DUF1735 domain-containing protein [Chitinophagaceae bacterium]